MAAHDTPKKLLARRRRANVAGGRKHRHAVLVTPEEEAQLLRLAEEQGVTVPRLLVESALAPHGQTHAAREDALRRVFAMQRTLTGAATNINQLARLGNAQQRLPVGTAEALRDLRTVVARLAGLLEELAS